MDIQNLFKNEEFVKGLMNKTTAEEAQAYFSENGVELTLSEINEIADTFKKAASGELSKEAVEKAANGELSENELENVAGGFGITMLGVVALAAVGSAAGTSVGILSVVQEWRW